jgi:coenzyme F420-0:L-glutamate ligase/coenzyme F420-1:gamma-L-glutamate ligase
VLPVGDHGPGAASLIRPEGADLFGYGAREAVVRALAGREEDRPPFGAPVEIAELLAVLGRVHDSDRLAAAVPDDGGTAAYDLQISGQPERTVVAAVCFAHGWRVLAWDDGETGVVARVSVASP